ncbi:MAG: AMP-binding protein [Eubacteriales bacterium]|nr:AMP-binding protein [Eubacteriales bacterium]
MKQPPLNEVRNIPNLKELLNQSAELFKDKAAFNVKNENGEYYDIKYREFKSNVDALGTVLIDLGLKNENIAIFSENRHEWCTAYMAVVNGTGVVVPLDKELPASEMENLLFRSNAAAVFYSGKYNEEMLQLAPNLPNAKYFINMDAEQDNQKFLSYSGLLSKGKVLLDSGDRRFIDAEIDAEAMSMLLFTSGTTDLAKGVMLSHKNISSNIMNVLKIIEIIDTDSLLSILPLHHTYECTCGFLAPVASGCAIAFNEGLKYIAANLKETSPSIILVVPLMLEGMYKKIWDGIEKKGMTKKVKLVLKVSNFLRVFGIDLRKKLFKSIHESFGGRVRLAVSGAAALEPSVAKGLRDLGMHAIQGYGLTECSPIVTANTPSYYRDDSIGIALPGVEVKIVNIDENGVGEIIVKGDNIMLGYYKNQEATEQVLKDGWLYTGDIGMVDEKGFFKISGRKKNVIITKNGKNVFPEEVEAYLNKSPYILESLVWGKEIEGYDETMICAKIVPDIEAIKLKLGTENVDNEEVHNLISAEVKAVNRVMSSYKRVASFEIREKEFDKTTTKKIKRYVES